jgi:hypothetical protein
MRQYCSLFRGDGAMIRAIFLLLDFQAVLCLPFSLLQGTGEGVLQKSFLPCIRNGSSLIRH